MSLADRRTLIEQLWGIVYADGVIDKYEEAAIRKVSELLYVPHSAFVKAKLAAANATKKLPNRVNQHGIERHLSDCGRYRYLLTPLGGWCGLCFRRPQPING